MKAGDIMKCASVYTYEIDNAAVALEEIKAQLDRKMILQRHTVGIIMCHPEFIGSGTLKFICDGLPFDIAGVTTAAQAINDEAGELLLTIFIMTSNDAYFKTGVTGCLNDDIYSSVKASYTEAAGVINETPKLALIFPPIMSKFSGDSYVEAWQRCLPGTPIFGTLAMDDTPNFEDSETIYNGDTYKDAIPFVICYGDINPRFMIATIPEDKTTPYKGEITSSAGSRVKEINGMNAYRYFESIGFEKNGESTVNYLFLPFLIDQKTRPDYDGIPVIRVLSSFIDEGTAVFHGDVDEGSTFTLLKCEPDDVIATKDQVIDELKNMSDVNGALLFSCVVRRIVTMGENQNAGIEYVMETMAHDIPFMMGCAGGEICPTVSENGVLTNRYHNYSLIILVI